MYLLDAITNEFPTVISIVGAGGKTSTLRTMGRELNERCLTGILTTSTHLGIDQLRGHPVVFCKLLNSPISPPDVLRLARAGVKESRVIFAISEAIANKAAGLDIPSIDYLAGHFDAVVTEADGARGRSLKAPSNEEPVWPSSTKLALAVIGIDALGRPLNEQVAHRPERIAVLTGQRVGELITHQTIATCVLHPGGIYRGVPASAKRIVLINKVNSIKLADARTIARLIRSHIPAVRTIIGDVRPDQVRIWK